LLFANWNITVLGLAKVLKNKGRKTKIIYYEKNKIAMLGITKV
jgi:hypothetical protein